MPPTTIVTCFPVNDSQIDELKSFGGPDFQWIVSDQDRIGEDIMAADIFCGHAKSQQIDWERVVSQGKLRWIQSSAAGLDHCLHPAVVKSEILVSGCSGLFANQVAEQACTLLLALVRKLPDFIAAQAQKSYIRLPTDNLFNKTVGIVGFGGNGQRIARSLKPMCLRLVATDLFPAATPDITDVEVWPADDLVRLFETVDVAIVTLPLTERNRKLIGRDCFEAMNKGSYFVNVGRGSVVDQTALIEALQSGQLAGAGLDVVDPEPLPADNPLWEMDHVIITPHVGAQSPNRAQETISLFCENLRRFQLDEPMVNLVDKELGFPLPQYRVAWS